ncbi:MAG: hypothetical protein ACYC2T_03900 [Bacillota bacterium]
MIARAIEKRGIATVTINMVRELAEQVKPPRTVITKFPFGAPLGDPLNRELQEKVIRSALDLLQTAKQAGSIVDLPYNWKERTGS